METLNLCLPKSWQELTDKQLQEVYTLLARNYTATELKARSLFSWSGLSVVYRNKDFVKVRFEGREHSLTELNAQAKKFAELKEIIYENSRYIHGNSR